ncbi:MAG: RDD family protein [Ktedonobacteraceae bacterium]
MSVGIRVVKLEGSSISWGESIVRNLSCVDHLPYAISYLLGVLLICTTPTKQHLRDRVEHAVVVLRF